MKEKVIIGIVAKHEQTRRLRENTVLRDEIKDAIFANGGVAIGILPSTRDLTMVDIVNENVICKNINKLLSTKEKENLIAQINLCDGIILGGGNGSDFYEVWIALYCYKHDIPLLAICAGQNNMIRAIGGSIKEIKDKTKHHDMYSDYVHDIFIKPNTKFYEMVKTTKMKVNSRHNRTIDNPNKLQVSAYDDDGNIEVVEDATKKCFIGLRFHPESLYYKDDLHNKIFKKFIEWCKK